MITTTAAINIFQARSCWWKNQRAFILAKKNCGKIKDQFNPQLSMKPPCSLSPGTNILFLEIYTDFKLRTLEFGPGLDPTSFFRKYYVLRLEVKSTAEVMEWRCKKIDSFTKRVLPSWNYYEKEKSEFRCKTLCSWWLPWAPKSVINYFFEWF